MKQSANDTAELRSRRIKTNDYLLCLKKDQGQGVHCLIYGHTTDQCPELMTLFFFFVFLFSILFLPHQSLVFFQFLCCLFLTDLNIPNICYHLSTVQGTLSVVIFPTFSGRAFRTHFWSIDQWHQVSLFSLSASVALQTCLPSSSHHPNHTLSIRSPPSL